MPCSKRARCREAIGVYVDGYRGAELSTGDPPGGKGCCARVFGLRGCDFSGGWAAGSGLAAGTGPDRPTMFHRQGFGHLLPRVLQIALWMVEDERPHPTAREVDEKSQARQALVVGGGHSRCRLSTRSAGRICLATPGQAVLTIDSGTGGLRRGKKGENVAIPERLLPG